MWMGTGSLFRTAYRYRIRMSRAFFVRSRLFNPHFLVFKANGEKVLNREPVPEPTKKSMVFAQHWLCYRYLVPVLRNQRRKKHIKYTNIGPF